MKDLFRRKYTNFLMHKCILFMVFKCIQIWTLIIRILCSNYFVFFFTITDVFKKQQIQSTKNNNFGFVIYCFESTDVSV